MAVAPPLSIVPPVQPEAPILVDSPHSGMTRPADFHPTASRVAILSTWDAFVDELWADAPTAGATLIHAHFPRAYVDVNRAVDDLDASVLDGAWPTQLAPTMYSQRGMGLIRRDALPGIPMYDAPLPVAAVQARLQQCYTPYREAVRDRCAALHARHAGVWHVNVHSMKSTGNAMNVDAGAKRPDVVVSDRRGTSADPVHTAWVADWFRARGLRTQCNDPYQGGDLVASTGAPALRRHSLQIEFNRALYMDEVSVTRSAGFSTLRATCAAFVRDLATYTQQVLAQASLFVVLAGLVVLLSWLLHTQGVTVTNPASGAIVEVTNLLSVAGVQRLVLGAVPNFINFAPFGPVLVCLLGLSVSEHSGFLGAVVRVIIGATPARLLTLVVVFIGATSSTAGDVGYVLLLPLSAALFQSAGRNPLAGLAAAFAGVSGGFAANLLLSPTDVILAGLTQEAARIIDPAYVVTPMANYYFLASSVLLVTLTGTFVTERVVEPRLGGDDGDVVPERAEPLTPREWRGLQAALLSLVVLTALVLWGLVPVDGYLIDPERPGFIGSIFLRGLVFWIFVFGLVPGLVYGVVVGTITRDVDVYRGMQKNMELIAGYTVVIFFIAQFVNIFNWSNLGVVLAVHGATLLRALDLGPIPLLITLVAMTGMINVLLGSSSAKWAMLAPVLVPMFMLLNYSPELTQTAYRVGDSLTNIITPLSSNFPLVLLFFQKYSPRAGIGTLTGTGTGLAPRDVVCSRIRRRSRGAA